MYQPTPLLFVFFLLLFSISSSHPTVPLCPRWQCITYENPPTNCVQAPTNPQPHHLRSRWRLPPSPGKRASQSLRITSTRTTATPSIHPRGNPVCYYPISHTNTYLLEGYQSLPFILPAGVYAVKWNIGHSTRSFANIAFYFEVLRKSTALGIFAYVQAVYTYGGTLVSDGIHEMALVLKNMNHDGSMQSAEVWLQEVT